MVYAGDLSGRQPARTKKPGDLEQPVELKGNRLQNFAAILQVRQAASVSVPCLPQQQCRQYRCKSSEQAALAFLFGEYFSYFFVYRLCAIFI